VEIPKEVAVTTNLREDSPKVVIDAEQVGRAFANIITNAVQAMSGKGR